MYRRLIILLILSTLLSNCATFKYKKGANLSVRQQRELAPFDRIIIKGKVNVNLFIKSAVYKVSMHANHQKKLLAVTTDVRNHTLIINYPSYLNKGPVEANIYLPVLTQFIYHGQGVIQAKNIRSKGLKLFLNNKGRTSIKGSIALTYLRVTGKNNYVDISGINSRDLRINLKDNPKVKLSGTMQLSSLTTRGCGWLSLYWLKSNYLKIKAYEGSYIQLAGIVDTLDAELWDKARFNGRYLRVQRAFVKTHQRAIAEINALKDQYTLASDNSNIYFYNNAITQNDFMVANGAVLNRQLSNISWK